MKYAKVLVAEMCEGNEVEREFERRAEEVNTFFAEAPIMKAR